MSESVPAYLRLELELETGEGRAPAAGRVRGVLGKALVDRSCPFGEPRCDPKGKERGAPPAPPSDLCRLAAACPYGALFAASLTRRPPFALYVPDGLDATGAVTIEITLYGPAWRLYAWTVGALVSALGSLGLRLLQVRRVHPDRRREELAGVDVTDLPADLAPDLLALAPEPFIAARPVAVELLSPTLLLSGGTPLRSDEPVPFDVLVKSTFDRFAGLYGDAASPVLAREVRSTVEAEAAKVPLVDGRVRAADASHYSRRSRSRLDLGGTVGRLLYGPQAAAFVHVLRTAEILHLGKNTTFGCGRLRVDIVG